MDQVLGMGWASGLGTLGGAGDLPVLRGSEVVVETRGDGDGDEEMVRMQESEGGKRGAEGLWEPSRLRVWDGSAGRGLELELSSNYRNDLRCGVTRRETAAVKSQDAQRTPLCVLNRFFFSLQLCFFALQFLWIMSAQQKGTYSTLSASSNMFDHHTTGVVHLETFHSRSNLILSRLCSCKS